MFDTIKKKVEERFAALVSNGVLFTTNPDRDKIWEVYLNAIPQQFRQEHTCNCCKSFLRQYGGIVGIGSDNKVMTLWDFDMTGDPEYSEAIPALRRYVASLPVADRFYAEAPKLGTDRTPDPKRGLVWTHFHVVAPREYILNKDCIPTRLGQYRTQKELLQRAVTEITPDAVETVQELIGQNSLYRGSEFKPMVDALGKAQKAAKKIPAGLLANYCWLQSSVLGPATCGIRNSAIGTLLQDLSEGKELDDAVRAYERVVAPTNYKRPTALVTPKMIEAAKTRLEELGLTSALKRRLLDPRDLTADRALFVHRAKSKATADVFDEMKEDSLVNPKSLSKVETVTMEDFLTGVLPTAKSVKVLVENQHLGNLVSLVGAVEDGPTLFKWDNNFSWSYAGEVADSIKERVKAAGGDVTGMMRASLSWHNFDDLDLRCDEVGEYVIYYGNKGRLSPRGGMLDVDMNAGSGTTREPVENITYSQMPRAGDYRIEVNQFSKREARDNNFEVEIEVDGEVHTFAMPNPSSGQTVHVATIRVARDGTATVIGSSGGKPARYPSKEKWGVKTGTFQTVRAITLSPNHWGCNVGNKHVFFLLEGCKAEDRVRPFYNEFLKEDLSKDRKVFEILGSKVNVEPREDELSGLGFSDTLHGHIYAEVEGAFKRTLKVTF